MPQKRTAGAPAGGPPPHGISFEEFAQRPFVLHHALGRDGEAAARAHAGRPSPPRLQNVFYDGIAHDRDSAPVLSFASAQTPLCAADCQAPPSGEWVAVFRAPDGSHRIRLDPFGFYNLFYTSPALNGAQLFACSNDFHALCAFLDGEGLSLAMDLEYLAPLIHSASNLFYQAYDNRTSCRQIRRLGADEEIAVGREVRVLRNDFFPRNPPPWDSYGDLLHRGLESSRETLRTLLLEAFPASSPVLFLSGGKDSRAALCILLAAVGAGRFSCYTHNPLTFDADKQALQEDLDLASVLVHACGLEWAANHPALHRTQISFDQSLSFWQDYRSNTYFKYSPGKFLGRADPLEIEIRGGAGDAIRGGFYEKLFAGSRIQDTPRRRRDDIVALYRHLVPKAHLPRRLYAASQDRFLETLGGIPGQTIRRVLDNHYSLHRNRYHFGNARQALSQNKLIVYPLARPEFFHAAERCPREKAGRVVFDIIEAVRPALNAIAFQGSQWPAEFLAGRHCAVPPPDRTGPSMERYWRIQEARRKPRLLTNRSMPELHFQPEAELLRRLDRNISECCSFSSSFSGLVHHKGFYQRCWANRVRRRPDLAMMVAKTESIAELFRPFHGHADRIALEALP